MISRKDYRLFRRRKTVYYAFDKTTKKFVSLKTKDKAEARRLIVAMNEPGNQAALNLSLARIYLKHSDPAIEEDAVESYLAERLNFFAYRWLVLLPEAFSVKQGECDVN